MAEPRRALVSVYRGHTIRIVREACVGGWMQTSYALTAPGEVLLFDRVTDDRAPAEVWMRTCKAMVDSALDAGDAWQIHESLDPEDLQACARYRRAA